MKNSLMKVFNLILGAGLNSKSKSLFLMEQEIFQ